MDLWMQLMWEIIWLSKAIAKGVKNKSLPSTHQPLHQLGTEKSALSRTAGLGFFTVAQRASSKPIMDIFPMGSSCRHGHGSFDDSLQMDQSFFATKLWPEMINDQKVRFSPSSQKLGTLRKSNVRKGSSYRWYFRSNPHLWDFHLYPISWTET